VTAPSAIFKAYDIRGLVPDELDPALARRIGAAAATVLADGAGAMVVGRDMRPSSPGLADAFADGVMAQGLDVVDIGLTSTDMMWFASGHLDLPAATFTASHNPAQYNGIKLCRAGAVPVSIESGLQDVRDLVLAGGPPAGTGQGTRRSQDVLPQFAEHVRAFVDPTILRPLRVAVDAGNGMAGHIVPAIFESLPFQLLPLFFELDGTFPNHPADPSDERNLATLAATVRDAECHIGLAFDGDADRMFAIDEQGRPVPSSWIGAVVAERLLRREPGATVLYNLICSRVVPETIAAAGGTPVRTRVGHSFIKQRMAETGALFACEHSGHYYFRDNFRADSGVIAAVLLLEALSAADAPLSAVVAPYARYPQSGEINFTVADTGAVIERVAAAFADRGAIDREDGLTVVTDAGWFNLRPSNTEPLLRLNVEADDGDALARLRTEVETVVGA